MFAVNGGHKDIIQRLVSAGADVHIRDKVCGDMESVCQMMYCALFHGQDIFLGLHMCMRKGGREGKGRTLNVVHETNVHMSL